MKSLLATIGLCDLPDSDRSENCGFASPGHRLASCDNSRGENPIAPRGRECNQKSRRYEFARGGTKLVNILSSSSSPWSSQEEKAA